MNLVYRNIRLSKSFVGDREAQAVAEVISDGRLGMGSYVENFERDLAAFINTTREIVCVSTGTAALHLALQACDIGPGAEVLVPTLTYVASFQAVSATGATPVPCDVLAETCTLDVEDAEGRITPRTRAIMPVHYASGSGDLENTYTLANKYGLRVIEDAAHAFGCRYRGDRIGSTGDIVCFSFDGIKNITSGEGGAIATADSKVIERVRDARLLGVEKDTEKRFAGQRSWDFDVARQGWRYHMNNLCAAIGRVQLARFDNELAPRRIELAKYYVQLLDGLGGVTHLDLEYGDIVPHIFPILIRNGRRNLVREALRCADVESGIHYKPNHLLSYYAGVSNSLPTAEGLYAELLSLPLHPELEPEEQVFIVDAVRNCCPT
jgi:dTDP-4-amino-4,6-dideoxygalactose transaminase